MTRTVRDQVLNDPDYRVTEAPEASGGVSWLRASVARFCEGPNHARRRTLAEQQLAEVSPTRLRESTGDPVEALAEALGISARVAQDVAVVARSYHPHTEITADADEAVDRLIAACGGNADEATACRIGLLVQASAAVAALIQGANPPVPTTRRTAPSGELIEVDLAGMAFGAGRHGCPARAHALALSSKRLPFHALHYSDSPLILPNAWDMASAAALADAGFSAIGTTSLGVAAAHGLPDAAGATLTETLDLVRKLVRLPVPISVDIEAGLGSDPAELAAQLWELGVAGVNLEDGRGDHLADPAEQARLLCAFKDAAPAMFLNARVDTHWLGLEQASTIDRAKRYADAGADGVFIPGLVDEREIAAAVTAVALPLNLLAQLDVQRLASLGVRRVSTGSLLFRAALGSALYTAKAVRDGTAIGNMPTYETIAALTES